MNALILTLFVSLMLALGAVLLFTWGYLKGEHDHADRLSLLPLEDEPLTQKTASNIEA